MDAPRYAAGVAESSSPDTSIRRQEPVPKWVTDCPGVAFVDSKGVWWCVSERPWRDGPARHAVPRIHVRRHRPSRAQLLAGLAALDARSTRSRELAAITQCAYLGAACWLRHRGSSENLLVRHRTVGAATRAVSRKSIGTEQRVVTEVRLGALRSPDRPRRTRVIEALTTAHRTSSRLDGAAHVVLGKLCHTSPSAITTCSARSPLARACWAIR